MICKQQEFISSTSQKDLNPQEVYDTESKEKISDNNDNDNIKKIWKWNAQTW